MKMGHLQNIQSFETSIETGNVQRNDEQSIGGNDEMDFKDVRVHAPIT